MASIIALALALYALLALYGAYRLRKAPAPRTQRAERIAVLSVPSPK